MSDSQQSKNPLSAQSAREPVPNGVWNASSSNEPLIRLNIRRALRMRGRWFYAFSTIGLLLSVVLILARRPVFSASTLVYVQPSPPRVLPNGTPIWPYDFSTYEMNMQQQINSFTRQDVLSGAVAKMRGTGWQGSRESDRAAADRLSHAFTALRDGDSYQIQIKAQASNADLAAKLANAIAESFLENERKQEDYGLSSRVHLLQQEQKRIENLLALDRGELESINKRIGVGAITADTQDPFDQDVSDLRTELAKARSEHDLAEARLLSEQNGAYSADAETQADADPGLISLKTGLYQRRSVLIAQMAGLTVDHPLYKQGTVELQQLDKNIDDVTRQIQDKVKQRMDKKLEGDVETSAETESRLSAELDKASSQAGDSTQMLQRASDLNADIDRLQHRFGVVDEQIHDQTLQDEAPSGIHIAAFAVPPLRADASKSLKFGLATLFVCMLLGFGTTVARNGLDPHIYIAEDIEQLLGASPLVTIPDVEEVSSHLYQQFSLRVAAALEATHIAEGYRRVLISAVTQDVDAAALAREVCAQLAMLNRPWQCMSTSSAAAVSETALHEMSGFEQIARRFRSANATGDPACILADAAPLLLSGETEFLARFSDVFVLVVASGKTRRADLRAAAQLLQRMNMHKVGFLLTGLKRAHADRSHAALIARMEAADDLAAQTKLRSERLVSRKLSRTEFGKDEVRG
uniref:Uncharacterized protein n=1 Tax=mine drainage metagenome TaxID=410659 RepID=E6QMG9_9ZZZZ